MQPQLTGSTPVYCQWLYHIGVHIVYICVGPEQSLPLLCTVYLWVSVQKRLRWKSASCFLWQKGSATIAVTLSRATQAVLREEGREGHEEEDEEAAGRGIQRERSVDVDISVCLDLWFRKICSEIIWWKERRVYNGQCNICFALRT